MKNTAIEYSENLKCVQSLLVPKASKLDFVFLVVIMMGTILREGCYAAISKSPPQPNPTLTVLLCELVIKYFK